MNEIEIAKIRLECLRLALASTTEIGTPVSSNAAIPLAEKFLNFILDDEPKIVGKAVNTEL